MTTGAADAIFIDTNILVYATVPPAPFHAAAVAALAAERSAGHDLWISRQILREYLAVLSRPQTFTPALSPSLLRSEILTFQVQFHIAEDGPSVTTNLLHLLMTVPTAGNRSTMLTSWQRCRPTASTNC